MRMDLEREDNSGSPAFRVWKVDVPRWAAEALRQQLEFYLSERNLITDPFLRNIVSTGKSGWVKANLFLSFPAISKILNNALPKLPAKTTSETIQTILIKACESSKLIEGKQLSIRKKGKSPIQHQFLHCLYIEGPQSQLQIKQDIDNMELEGFEGRNFWVRSWKGKQYYIVEFHPSVEVNTVKQIKVELIQRYQSKILLGKQFLEAEKQYLKLLDTKPFSEPQTTSDIDLKLPIGRIVSFSQAQECIVPPKERKPKPNYKHNRTRLPQSYFHFGNKYVKTTLPFKRKPRIIKKKPKRPCRHKRLKLNLARQDRPKMLHKLPEVLKGYHMKKMKKRLNDIMEKKTSEADKKVVQNKMKTYFGRLSLN